jgi:hypothetical protein
MMEMDFLEFCVRYANPEPITIEDPTQEVPMNFREPLRVLVNLVRLKLPRADSIKISFVQNKFENMNEVKEIMENEYHGEVMESISQALAQELYHQDYNALQYEETLIIKILTIYLMLQNATQTN